MTPTEILALARECGALVGRYGSVQFPNNGSLDRFAAAVSAREREAIYAVALEICKQEFYAGVAAERIETLLDEAIRARGTKP